MQNTRRLFQILGLNLLALFIMCAVIKLAFGDGPAFLVIFIFGIVANLVLLPLNLFSLIWRKLRWWIVLVSAAWSALVFDPFTKEAYLTWTLITINQLAFWLVKRKKISGS